jgi:hypothetical protein
LISQRILFLWSDMRASGPASESQSKSAEVRVGVFGVRDEGREDDVLLAVVDKVRNVVPVVPTIPTWLLQFRTLR